MFGKLQKLKENFITLNTRVNYEIMNLKNKCWELETKIKELREELKELAKEKK